jgi:hypothetical protein
MPKVYTLTEKWSRGLPIADVLRIGEELEALAARDPTPVMQAKLRDGSVLKAATVASLRAEMALESVADFRGISIGIGEEDTVQTWWIWEKRDVSESLSLQSSGEQESMVHGTFGPLKRRIENRFDAIDGGDTEPWRLVIPKDQGGVTIGSISDSNVAVSGSGPASSSSSPSGDPPPGPWWQQAWITIGAPIVVLVAAGIILALALGH